MDYSAQFGTKKTPQSEKIPGSKQVENSAGGFAFAVDDWVRLDRFLILGNEGGSYYATERAMTKENAEAVLRCIKADGQRAVGRMVEISHEGRAPKNDPAIFALAMAASLGDPSTRQVALDALSKVCRIGTHLFHFAQAVQSFRGWGRGLRRAVGGWYLGKSAEDLAYQIVKYQQRDGWSHRDLLRLSHPKAEDAALNGVLKWAVGKADSAVDLLPVMLGFELTQKSIEEKDGKRSMSIKPEEAAKIITQYGLPREAVPTEWLTSKEVWAALLESMPMTAMIRNLATMTRVGLIEQMGDATAKITGELLNQERLRKARVHPIAILAAMLTYASGHGVRGKAEWSPVAAVIDALDKAFYLSFGNVEATGKRIVLALDVSGSMESGVVAGIPGLTPRVASAAMALVTANVEPNHCFVAFTSGQPGEWGHQQSAKGQWSRSHGIRNCITELTVSPRQRLDDVCAQVSRLPMGGTDCALPMLWALDKKLKADAFVVLTDSETWAGEIHPVQALRDYRAKMNVPAKLVVVGMVSNGFSIADPDDGGMLDCVGFDTAAPRLISDFIRQ